MIMPWGKYVNKDIEDLPSSYLKWLAENCDDDEIAEAADEEYRWRETHNQHLRDLRG